MEVDARVLELEEKKRLVGQYFIVIIWAPDTSFFSCSARIAKREEMLALEEERQHEEEKRRRKKERERLARG